MKRLQDHRRSNTHLAALFFAPTCFIVALGIVLILSLLKSSAVRLDQSQQSAELRLAQSVVTTLVTALEKSVADYANWDDMYDQFAKSPDPQWARENLGPYAIDAFGLSHILVLAADGSIKYDFTPQPEADGRPDPAEIAALHGFVQSAMSSWRVETITSMGGAISIHGRPHLVAMSPIAVNSEARKLLGDKPQNSLIFLQDLDENRLAGIGSAFGLTGLRTTFGADGIVPLDDPLNTPGIVSLVWTRSQVGSEFVSDAMPSILIVGATVIVLFVFLGFGWAVIVGRIRQGARAAEEANHSKGQFVANMTHELRTPLNAIIGFSEIMSTETLGPMTNPKYKEYAHDIASSGQHLLRIVNNILLFSKIEAGRLEVNVERVDLERTVADVVRIMQIEGERRRVRLVQDPFHSAVMVSADLQSLNQILFNLIGNAIKFSDEDGEVRVGFGGLMAGGTCRLQISDQGCGIPEKILSELGTAFVQADNTYSRKHQGTGLGLAICFGLAEHMGASLEIASVENVGTTVSIIMPINRAAVGGSSQPHDTTQDLRRRPVAALR